MRNIGATDEGPQRGYLGVSHVWATCRGRGGTTGASNTDAPVSEKGAAASGVRPRAQGQGMGWCHYGVGNIGATNMGRGGASGA